MAEEKIFTIPLGEVYSRTRNKRAKKAMAEVRRFLVRHMKTEEVRLGKSINLAVWKRGIQKPPRRIRVHATKQDEVVYAELVGVDIKPPTKEELKKKEEKKEEKKKKIKEERKERKKQTIQEEIEEKPKPQAKEEEKEEKPKPAEEKPGEKA